MTTIGDIFDIPIQVHQGDFVLRLTEGVTRPADTLRTYVVTPQLVGCFDQALDLIRSALETNTSKGAYLHGSFGSGSVQDVDRCGRTSHGELPAEAWAPGCHGRVRCYHQGSGSRPRARSGYCLASASAG